MPLQKSFSDQNHSARSKAPRQQWARNKTHSGHKTTGEGASSGPLRERPPVPVSTATKNKLRAFQFEESENVSKPKKKAVVNASSNDEKENETVLQEKRTPDRASQSQNSGEDLLVLPKLWKNEVPVTPAGRLALMDLVGMGDVMTLEQNISPEERLEWDHNKDIIRSSISRHSGPRKTRKRARSSSPTHSSPTDLFDLEKTTDLSGTPVDPGSDLWGRFSLHASNIQTPRRQLLPGLANLLCASSPQAVKEGVTPRSVAKFRRSNSCGNQFPKRRRLGHADDTLANAGPSKLSALIEKVQEQLTQPTNSLNPSELTNPASSNEVPEEAADKEVRQLGVYGSSASPQSHMQSNIYGTLRPPNMTVENSSDYGDDIDVSLLDVFDDSRQTPILSRSGCEDDNYRSHHRRDLGAGFAQSSISGNPKIDADDDEFDESDTEMFAADMELLAAKYDISSATQGTQGLFDVGDAEIQSRKQMSPRNHGSASEESGDEFGSDGLSESDLAAAEITATQAVQQSTSSLLPSLPKTQAIQRYLVTNVLFDEYTTVSGSRKKEKVLFLHVDQNKNWTKVVHLRGAWFETPVNSKAYVHVIGTFDARGHCVIDDDYNILILHPDHLISSTVVGDSFGCLRRAVLQDRVKATSENSAPLLYGTILHELFQAALLANRWDTEWLYEKLEAISTTHLEDLYTIHLPVSQAVEYLMSKMPELQTWAEMFVSAVPKHNAIVQAGNGQTANMCVSKLLDVEEHVWSPMYGLKGNIDATVQVTMKDGAQLRTLTVPFEVKTGKNPTAAHRAQTALYTLLLSDRYDVEIAYGILYYMETSETIRIPSVRRELLHMIMQRNELACFVRERHAQLPPMLKKENMCNRCYAQVPCFIYHRLADDGTGKTSGLDTKFDEVVKHLNSKHRDFFLKWDHLLTQEEKESMKFRRELWTMLSSEREKKGSCFSKVIIEPGSAHESQDSPKINRYRYNMVKQNPEPGFSFLESQIVAGDPIVISDERGHYALACGYATHIRKTRITVAVDRRLHNSRIRQPGFDEHDNQIFASIMDVGLEGSQSVEPQEGAELSSITYRLDKDEFSNGMATARNNIIQVMAQGPFGSQHIRSLVVDLNAPRFKTSSISYDLRDRHYINIDQERAIQKVMSAEDYALILGMPGTGKTTTIAHIIRSLVSQGKSVLLTSYTHTAVDNILLKLKEDDIPILRLGTLSKIHPEVQEFARLAVSPKESFEAIRSAWHDTPIVGTTCLGINHPLFNERVFDYCIVDEASQITLPVCLGPIRLARTFILVGDHYQLPPLVQNEEARLGGLDISLFKHLSDNHPSSVVYLEHQYRMCEDVMALSNNLIYNGRLKCGNQEVATKSISIPDISALRHHHVTPSTLSRSQRSICAGPNSGKCWIQDMLHPRTKVAFLNTDPLLPLSREEARGNRIVNPTEATICTQLVEALLTVGIRGTDIGVMTHYRSQLSRLKDGLRSHGGVEMHTTDRFQGRDKEVIILSLVRSNEQRSIGELLKDWRRINVAFTRAKTKLLVIGSRGTLLGNGPDANGEEEMVARFIKLMEQNDWIYDLPKSALADHYFEEGATQVSINARGTSPSLAERKRGRSSSPKRAVLNLPSGKENSPAGKTERPRMKQKQPNKKVLGNKPFKMPRMGVLRDVLNENSY